MTDYLWPKADTKVCNQTDASGDHDVLADEGFLGGPSKLTFLIKYADHFSFRV